MPGGNAFSYLLLIGCLFCSSTGATEHSAGGEAIDFNIPRQRADLSLTQFARKVDLTLIFPYDKVKDKTANRLVGKYELEEAIDKLLNGTGLAASFNNNKVLNIKIEKKGDHMKTNRNLLAAVIGFLAGTGAGNQVVAAPASQGGQAALEEIVVTAQKRSERLLDVPMSITAISGEILEDSNISSTGDLGQLAPGLTTVSNGLAFTPAIRGISSSGSSPGDETNVSLYLDDVYIGAPLAGLFDLKDIERVEVLKGPQGTLFGRNATGGAIRIVTRAPAFEPSAEVSADYGFEYDAVKLGTYVTGPLSDNVAASFSGYYKEDDGFVKGISPELQGESFSKTDNFGVRSKVLFDAGSDLSFTLIGDYSERSDDRMFNLVPRDGRNANEDHPDYITPVPYELTASTKPIFEVDTWGVSLTAEWAPSDLVDVRSITAYREVEGLYQTDTDRTNLSIASLLLSQTQDTFSQELIFSGDATDRLSWLGGLYYYSSDAAAPFFNSYGGDAPDGPLVFNFNSQVDTTSYSAFGELNYDVTDRLHLTLGVRYTDEEKEYFYENIFDAMADESESWNNTSYRVVGRYDFSDSSNVYLSYSTGFKSGVYNAYGLPTTGPVEPEEIEAWELGAKARWMGITFSGAIFAYEYTDIQVQGQTFLPDGTWVVTLNNAAEAEIEGIELSASGPLTDNLSFNIGYSGLPTAEYSDYPTAQVFIFNEATGGTDSVVPFDATGSRIIRAPRHQANAQLVYERTVKQGRLRAAVTYSYNDGFYWQPGDLTPEDSFDPINARISWTDPRDRYTFTVWGENLTDEQYSVYTATTAAGIADAYTQPLQVGVGISARF